MIIQGFSLEVNLIMKKRSLDNAKVSLKWNHSNEIARNVVAIKKKTCFKKTCVDLITANWARSFQHCTVIKTRLSNFSWDRSYSYENILVKPFIVQCCKYIGFCTVVLLKDLKSPSSKIDNDQNVWFTSLEETSIKPYKFALKVWILNLWKT